MRNGVSDLSRKSNSPKLGSIGLIIMMILFTLCPIISLTELNSSPSLLMCISTDFWELKSNDLIFQVLWRCASRVGRDRESQFGPFYFFERDGLGWEQAYFMHLFGYAIICGLRNSFFFPILINNRRNHLTGCARFFGQIEVE